ncbi:hypothetical protein [Aneurinibacillus tyrosinisolvens]|uniref:hypothetical protein n=1 Tax=Aneurinibacillus tyrosinisolvens TaxID=1443435 RepID=UPI00063F57EF|nr:hypothetical protein [Aneurinibacillus tyrosinisolvens]
MNIPVHRNFILDALLNPDDEDVPISGLLQFIRDWEAVELRNEGNLAMYAVVAQKADFVFLHLRETMVELNAIEKVQNAVNVMSSYALLRNVETITGIDHGLFVYLEPSNLLP